MTTNRVIVALLLLAVFLQGVNFYQQYYGKQIKSMKRESPVRNAPKDAVLDPKDLPSKGSDGARVAIIEFSDYECPFCSRYATGGGREIEKEFVQTGKVKFVFVNNPLPIHPNAKSLATAAICAGNQGLYWKMHDSLFSVAPKDKEAVRELSLNLRLDPVKFQQCSEKSVEAEKRIERDIQYSKALELTGTPSFGIGRFDSQGKVRIEKLVIGAQPLTVFEKAINEVLDSSVGS